MLSMTTYVSELILFEFRVTQYSLKVFCSIARVDQILNFQNVFLKGLFYSRNYSKTGLLVTVREAEVHLIKHPNR